MIQHFLYSTHHFLAAHHWITISAISCIVAGIMIRIAYMDIKGRYDHPERETSEYLDYKDWNN